MYQPLPGVVFVRPIVTAETLPNGSIILPESYRDRLTAQQGEVVAIGPPKRCDELEDCERVHVAGCHPLDPAIVPGAWVLLAKWSYVGVADDLYAVTHDDILGVFIEAPATPAVRPRRSRAGSRPARAS